MSTAFNTRFEEAVYRFAQIAYDSNVKVAPVLFTWPSGGDVLDYVYDRDSAIYSRDALEKVLQTIADDPNVGVRGGARTLNGHLSCRGGAAADGDP